MAMMDRGRQRFLLAVKGLIILAPLPFGCASPIFQSLFFLALLSTAMLGRASMSADEPAWRLLAGKWPTRFCWLAAGWIILQLLPLPLFLLNLLAPHSVKVLSKLQDALPIFHPLSQIPALTLEFAMRALVALFFFRVFVAVPLEKREMQSIQYVMIFSGAAQAFFGLIKLFSGNHNFFLLFYPDPRAQSHLSRLTGTIVNSDHFAVFLNLLIPLALAHFFSAVRYVENPQRFRDYLVQAVNSDRHVTLLLASIAVMTVALFLTASRAGILAFVLMMILFSQCLFYVTHSRRTKKKLKYILITVLLLATAMGMQNTIRRLLNTTTDFGAGRLEFWKDTLTMIANHPLFGTGLGTYRYAYFPYFSGTHNGWVTNAHNDYLELLAEGGIPGALLILALLVTPLFLMVRIWMGRHHPLVRTMGAGFMAAFFALLVQSFFDFALSIPAVLFYTLLLLGLGLKWTTYRQNAFLQKIDGDGEGHA